MNQTFPNPTELGRIFAVVFLSLIALAALAGVVFGVVGLRRRNTNPCCAWSLILVLGTWFVVCVAAAISSRLGPTVLPRALQILLGLQIFCAFLGGPVIAVMGLVQFYRVPRRWPSGALAGWSALAVSLFVMAFAGLGLLVNYASTHGSTKSIPKDAVRTAEGRWRFADFNFEFRPPDGAWTSQSVPTSDGTHRVVLQKFAPPRVLILIPEKLPPSVTLNGSARGVAEFAKNFVRGSDPNAVIRREVSVTVDDLHGIQFEADTTVGTVPSFQIQWCFSRRGWAYQILLRGPRAQAEAIRKEAVAIFEGFSLLDKNRAAPGWELLGGERFQSANYPYTVNYAGSEWRLYPRLAQVFPAAEFGAIDERDLDLSVLPFALPQPIPSADAIMTALLAPTAYGTMAKNFKSRTPWRQGDLQGETVTLERTDLDEPWLGRLRFVWGRQTAFLLVASGTKKAAPTSARLDSLLDRVVIEDAAPMVAADRQSLARRQAQALFLNQLGLHPFQAGHFEEADGLFRQASALWPANPIYLANQSEALASLKQYSNGLARLETRLPLVVTNLPLRATRAFFQWKVGDTNAAIRHSHELFEEGFDQESHFSIYARLLLETGQTNAVLKEMEAFTRTNSTTSAKLLYANLLRRLDDLPGAVRVLKAERDRGGLSAELGYSLADIYLVQGDASAAYEVCEVLLAKGYETANSWALRGRAELQLKKLPEARKSFEAAAKLDPENADLRASLARVSAMMGQTDNSAIKTPLPPVNTPRELTGDWPAPLPPDQVAPHGAQYLDRSTAIHFEVGKERRETSKWRVAIYDRVGLDRFSTLHFDFDPLKEAIYINELVVRDAEGRVTSTGRADDYYVTDDSLHAAQGIASLRKQLNVPVAGLQPGRTLEVTITRRDLVPPATFEWLEDVFERQTPAARLLTYVEGDVDRLRWESSPEVKLRRGDHFVAWQRDRTPAWISEQMEPVSFAFRPQLWVTDTSLSWPGEITNYLAVLTEKLGPDAETRAAHALETAGIAGREERIRALAKSVQAHCDYRAIEFGRRARVPNRAGETLRHHYGDCKDQAVLLHELLALSGVPSHLVLANPRQPVHTNLVSLDQFTHMILFLPGDDGGRFVDTTGRLVDPFLSPSWSIGGMEVLVLDPANPRFMKVPPLAPDSAGVSVERELTVTNGTDVVIHDEVIATGVAAAWFRFALNSNDGSSFKIQAQRMLSSLSPAFEVETLTGRGFDDSLEPIRFRFTGRLRNQFQRVGDRLVGNLPALWEQFWVGAGPPAERRAPLEIRQPYLINVRTRLVLPAGYDWPDVRRLTASKAGDFVDASLGVQETGDPQVLTTRCALHAGVFPADRDGERRQALTEAIRLVTPPILLEKRVRPAVK